jgi:predicted ArsR family transcriptional regulator
MTDETPGSPRLRPDPARDIVPDPRTLRGVAHPLRIRLLGLLRRDGPSTATRLAERTGVSSAAASYHLRSLGAYGFVVEDDGPPDKHGRERWWRAAHRGTWIEEVPPDPEGLETYVEYLRAVAYSYTQRIDTWLDELSSAPAGWRQAATLSDVMLRLSEEEAEDLHRRLETLLAQYRRHDPAQAGPAGTLPVAVQWQILPQSLESR